MKAFDYFRLTPRENDFLLRKVGSRGEIFFDSNDNTLRLYTGQDEGGIPLLRADLENIEGVIGAALGETPPTGVEAGTIWFNTATGKLFVYYNDGNSSQWVQPTSLIYGGGGGSGATAITELTDVSITTPTVGQVLKFNGSVWVNGTDNTSGGGGGGASSFSELTGTIGLTQISNNLITPVKLNLNSNLVPTANESYDLGSDSFRWRDLYLSGNSINLGAATITASGSSVVLPAGTTIDGDAITGFSIIAVAGQSNVIADSAADTLTFVAGPGIQITTNPGSDSITITNTGSGGGGASGVSAGQANRLAYYASTGSVIQDTGAGLTWNGSVLSTTGTISAAGQVSYVRAYFETLTGLNAISPSTWHGMVAHVHETGRMYFAHAGAWDPLANLSDLNIFKTISVAGQNNIVADSATDTLTFVAGSNVTITTDSATDTITISAATGGGGATTLDGLTDVAISSPSIGQVLKYNGTTWVNDSDATGGGGVASNSFETIAIAGQSSLVADSSTDTLTLVAGSNITLTTNATNDTITIAASSATTAFNALTDSITSSLTIDKIYLPAITMLTVTNSGASAYLFDQYSGNNPTIYAISGTTIAFNLNVLGHPFLIQTGVGTNYNTGLVHVATNGTVLTGSSAQGQTSGTLYWKIPASVSGGYRYQCSVHGPMVGSITIKDVSII